MSSLIRGVVVALLLLTAATGRATATAQGTAQATSRAPAALGSTHTLRGTVYDSLAGAPLAGATVSLVYAAHPERPVQNTTTDAAGQYEFLNVRPDAYLIGFLHPILDSLGIEPPTRRLVVPDDPRQPTVIRDLGVPGAQAIHDAVCASTPNAGDTTGVLLGHLRSALTGDPVAGRVVAQWSVIGFSQGRLTQSYPAVSVTPGAGGWFGFCGLPPGTPIAIQATSGTDSSGIVMLTIPARRVSRRNLYVAPRESVAVAPVDSAAAAALPDSLRAPAAAHRHGAGRIAGTARDVISGLPLSGVSVTVEGTAASSTTNARGEFSLGDLPLGTQTLLARKVGYVPDERPVDVLAAGSPPVQTSLTTMQAMLDTMHIVASTLYASDRSGFLSRRKTGVGHYFGPDDIEKDHPLYASDILWRVPGVRVRTSGFDKIALMRGAFGNCVPTIYLDGTPLHAFSIGDLDTMVQPEYIAGIEIYSSAAEAPPQFVDFSTGCGSIVIWTRNALPRRAKP